MHKYIYTYECRPLAQHSQYPLIFHLPRSLHCDNVNSIRAVKNGVAHAQRMPSQYSNSKCCTYNVIMPLKQRTRLSVVQCTCLDSQHRMESLEMFIYPRTRFCFHVHPKLLLHSASGSLTQLQIRLTISSVSEDALLTLLL